MAMEDIYTEAGAGSGKIFSVEFIKKDGERRVMVCRRGVSKGVKGVGMSFDPKERGLFSVYDMKKGDFRFVPLDADRVIKVKGRGKVVFSMEGDE